jgi:general secretion pathway protein G
MQTSRISRREGFTLLELMVVITIIGLLSAVVVVNTRKVPEKARQTAVEQDLKNILNVAEHAHVETGRWPESIEEMAKNTDLTVRLETIPRDPWKNSYVYDLSSETPTVTCLGSDGQPGGTGEAADRTLPEPLGGE